MTMLPFCNTTATLFNNPILTSHQNASTISPSLASASGYITGVAVKPKPKPESRRLGSPSMNSEESWPPSASSLPGLKISTTKESLDLR